jgi:hypothetical protein
MSLRPLAIAALAVAAGLCACAAERVERRAAHGAFARDGYANAWERAAGAVEAQGFAIEMRDRQNGILVTNERELQAPCGAESCLSRDRVFVRLTPAGQAVVNIEREHWDAAARRWSASSDPAAVAAVEKAQLEVLRAIVPGELALRRSAVDEPCRDAGECQAGLACDVYRCRKR